MWHFKIIKRFSSILLCFIFVLCLDISVSKVFRIKSTFCEHLLIVRRWKKPDWNHKNNARLFWFGFTVWFSSYPSALLHVVSITNFFCLKNFLLGLRNRYFFSLCRSYVWKFFGFIFPSLSAINLWTSARTWCKITSRRSRRLIGQFSFSSCSKYGTCEKWIITSIVQNLHMRVTRSVLMSFWFQSVNQSIIVRQ